MNVSLLVNLLALAHGLLDVYEEDFPNTLAADRLAGVTQVIDTMFPLPAGMRSALDKILPLTLALRGVLGLGGAQPDAQTQQAQQAPVVVD